MHFFFVGAWRFDSEMDSCVFLPQRQVKCVKTLQAVGYQGRAGKNYKQTLDLLLPNYGLTAHSLCGVNYYFITKNPLVLNEQGVSERFSSRMWKRGSHSMLLFPYAAGRSNTTK